MNPRRKIVWLCLACHEESDEKQACHPDEVVRMYEDTILRGLNASGGARVFALTVSDDENEEQKPNE